MDTDFEDKEQVHEHVQFDRWRMLRGDWDSENFFCGFGCGIWHLIRMVDAALTAKNMRHMSDNNSVLTVALLEMPERHG